MTMIHGSIEDTQHRRQSLAKIVMDFRRQGKQITRYGLQPELKKVGFDVSYSTVYRDLTVLNRANTYVRDLSESNYSAYQEDIANSLDWVEQQARAEFLDNKTYFYLGIIMKVQDLKIKHTNGDNINISVALLGKKLDQMKSELQKYEMNKMDVLKLASNTR
jgi:hypothetical protein